MILIALVLFIFSQGALAASQAQWDERYPNQILTPDYGILTDDDFTFDLARRVPRPYNPTSQFFTIYWQCFKTKDIRLPVKYWQGTDGMAPSTQIRKMCDIDIWARRDGETHAYFGRRAHHASYCEDFLRNWNHLTHHKEYVCLNGEVLGQGPESEAGGPKQANVVTWIWGKFKTNRGCYSNFSGDCEVGALKPNRAQR